MTFFFKSDIKSYYQTTLSLFGQQPNLDGKLAESTEAFIRDLYPKTRRQTSTMDALRYVMFCQQRKRKNEALPPTSDSLRQHMKRANYQTFIWRSSLVAMQDLQSPVGHGWELEDDCLKPVYTTKDPAPLSLIELTTCNCKRSQCQGNCSCYNSDLSCTEACLKHAKTLTLQLFNVTVTQRKSLMMTWKTKKMEMA